MMAIIIVKSSGLHTRIYAIHFFTINNMYVISHLNHTGKSFY